MIGIALVIISITLICSLSLIGLLIWNQIQLERELTTARHALLWLDSKDTTEPPGFVENALDLAYRALDGEDD